MAEFFTYSPDRVIITFGSVILRGFAGDTFIEIERDEDGFMKLTGSLGDVARTRNLNRGAKVTLTLMAVSPANDDLSALAALDEIDGDIVQELMIRDLSGNMECHATYAWVQKWPKIERGKESGTIQWVFDCADVSINASGNQI